MNTLENIQKRMLEKFEYQKINKHIALKNTHVLDLVREACLIESYFAMYTAKMTHLFWYDIEATTMFTIESSEAFIHYFALRKYLDKIGYKVISDQELIDLRKKDKDVYYDNEIKELVNFMMTEHFAAHFFRDLAKVVKEPILKTILNTFSGEEIVHSQFAYDLLKKRLTERPALKTKILK